MSTSQSRGTPPGVNMVIRWAILYTAICLGGTATGVIIEMEMWPGIAHSYSIVGANLALSLADILGRSNIRIVQAPPYRLRPEWAGKTAPIVRHGRLRLLDQLSAAARHKNGTYSCPDLIMRSSFPIRLRARAECPSTPVFVLGTTEFGVAPIHLYQDPVGEEINCTNHSCETATACKPLSWAEVPRNTVVLAASRWAAMGFVTAGIPARQVVVLEHGVDPVLWGAPWRRWQHVDSSWKSKVRNEWTSRHGIEFEGHVSTQANDEIQHSERRCRADSEQSKCLWVLSAGSGTLNKGIDTLIRSTFFALNSLPSDPRTCVCLVIKGLDSLYNSSQSIEAAIRTNREKVSPNKQIGFLLTSSELSPEALAALFAGVDIYAAPYRGEGFALPVLEAAAAGTPALVTGNGASDDYVLPTWAIRVPSVRVSAHFGGESGVALRVNEQAMAGCLAALISAASLRKQLQHGDPSQWCSCDANQPRHTNGIDICGRSESKMNAQERCDVSCRALGWLEQAAHEARTAASKRTWARVAEKLLRIARPMLNDQNAGSVSTGSTEALPHHDAEVPVHDRLAKAGHESNTLPPQDQIFQLTAWQSVEMVISLFSTDVPQPEAATPPTVHAITQIAADSNNKYSLVDLAGFEPESSGKKPFFTGHESNGCGKWIIRLAAATSTAFLIRPRGYNQTMNVDAIRVAGQHWTHGSASSEPIGQPQESASNLMVWLVVVAPSRVTRLPQQSKVVLGRAIEAPPLDAGAVSFAASILANRRLSTTGRANSVGSATEHTHNFSAISKDVIQAACELRNVAERPIQMVNCLPEKLNAITWALSRSGGYSHASAALSLRRMLPQTAWNHPSVAMHSQAESAHERVRVAASPSGATEPRTEISQAQQQVVIHDISRFERRSAETIAGVDARWPFSWRSFSASPHGVHASASKGVQPKSFNVADNYLCHGASTVLDPLPKKNYVLSSARAVKQGSVVVFTTSLGSHSVGKALVQVVKAVCDRGHGLECHVLAMSQSGLNGTSDPLWRHLAESVSIYSFSSNGVWLHPSKRLGDSRRVSGCIPHHSLTSSDASQSDSTRCIADWATSVGSEIAIFTDLGVDERLQRLATSRIAPIQIVLPGGPMLPLLSSQIDAVLVTPFHILPDELPADAAPVIRLQHSYGFAPVRITVPDVSHMVADIRSVISDIVAFQQCQSGTLPLHGNGPILGTGMGQQSAALHHWLGWQQQQEEEDEEEDHQNERPSQHPACKRLLEPDTLHLLFVPHTQLKLSGISLRGLLRYLAARPSAVALLLDGLGPVWSALTMQRAREVALTSNKNERHSLFEALARIVTTPRLNASMYAAALTASDAVFDTWPYSGVTTTIEAAISGKPVVDSVSVALGTPVLCPDDGNASIIHLRPKIPESMNGWLTEQGGLSESDPWSCAPTASLRHVDGCSLWAAARNGTLFTGADDAADEILAILNRLRQTPE